MRIQTMSFYCLVSFLLSLPFSRAISFGKDKLVVISPHRKSIQREVIPLFKEHYKKEYGVEIEVDWIDQGGTENDLRYVRSKFHSNPQSAQIDVFWGGGDVTFHDLANEKLLLSHQLPPALAKQLPPSAAGIPLRNEQGEWFATAISSFGLFYNKKVLKFVGLKHPDSWEDLADPSYFSYVSVSDPRHSSSSLLMNIIILQALGWEKGWQTLAAIAGNSKQFTHSSSDPIKDVVSGDAGVATAIDFYAYAKIADLGAHNLGFTLPAGKTIFNSDPVGILKGAPHEKSAHRFVNFLLSSQAQKLLLLPQDHKDGGPKHSVLGRMAVNTQAYQETEGKRISEINPFTLAAPSFTLDINKATRMKQLFSDLLGAIHVDPHGDLKAAWQQMIKQGLDAKTWQEFARPPISEEEMWKLIEQWDNNVLRNQMINQWASNAQAKYKKIAQGALLKKSA